MSAIWTKLSILGAVALAAAAAGVGACTVTSGNVTDTDSGTTNEDSGPGTDGGTDSTPGTDSGGGAACIAPTVIGTAGCTECAGSKCCDTVNGCFKDTVLSDGGKPECADYADCVDQCSTSDAGPDAGSAADCITDLCNSAFPNAVAKDDAWRECLKNSCATECPQ